MLKLIHNYAENYAVNYAANYVNGNRALQYNCFMGLYRSSGDQNYRILCTIGSIYKCLNVYFNVMVSCEISSRQTTIQPGVNRKKLIWPKLHQNLCSSADIQYDFPQFWCNLGQTNLIELTPDFHFGCKAHKRLCRQRKKSWAAEIWNWDLRDVK